MSKINMIAIGNENNLETLSNLIVNYDLICENKSVPMYKLLSCYIIIRHTLIV